MLADRGAGKNALPFALALLGHTVWDVEPNLLLADQVLERAAAVGIADAVGVGGAARGDPAIERHRACVGAASLVVGCGASILRLARVACAAPEYIFIDEPTEVWWGGGARARALTSPPRARVARGCGRIEGR